MAGQEKSKVTFTFAIYRGDQLIERKTVTRSNVVIGRDPKASLRLDDELVSRMHAAVEAESPDEITLTDFGNEPKTAVNGMRVEKCKLQPGDQIQIGSTVIVLEKAEAASSQPQVPPPPAASPFEAGPADNAAAPAAASGAAASAEDLFGSGDDPFGGAPAADPFGGAAVDPFGGGSVGVEPAGDGPGQYVMMKSGPDVNPAEVEDPNTPAVEVMILWGDSVLHVEHLAPPRSFYVGEQQDKNLKSDYFIPQEQLGTTRAPVVLAPGDGNIYAVILPNAKGWVKINGEKKTVEELISSGQAAPCPEVNGGKQVALPPGSTANIELPGPKPGAGIVFKVSATAAGKKPAAGIFGSSHDWTTAAYVGLSAVVHVGLLSAMAFFMPPFSLLNDDAMSEDQLYLIQQYLSAAAEREMEEKETEQVAEDNPDNREGGTGTRAKGEEGSMGDPNSRNTNRRYGVAGPKNNPDPHIARAAALREAQTFGMIGLLNAGAGGDPNAPTAPWGRDDSLGNDPISARGNMWGDSIGDAFGAGGLGLSGIGEGGGGRGEGIGLGSIGTIGHGAGTGTGQGFGSGHGRLGGSHRTRPPRVRMGATTVNGRLPPEVIQRIVRQNYGRFRLCYEQGLRNNPSLQGRVTVRFVIGRDGSVTQVSNAGSDLPDPGVVSCVTRAYYGLSFPKPEGGIVTVIYPISFTPGG